MAINNNIKMQGKDAVYAGLAEAYITIGRRRYNFMQLTEFESHYDVNITDIPILGQTNMGHKASGAKGTWSAKAHYNQSVMRQIALEYQRTGFMPYFDIQVSNEDPTSAVGRQTIVHKNCLSEKFTLAKFKAGEEILEEDLSGTFESFEMPEKFKELPGF
jgi:hypothetical protein